MGAQGLEGREERRSVAHHPGVTKGRERLDEMRLGVEPATERDLRERDLREGARLLRARMELLKQRESLGVAVLGAETISTRVLGRLGDLVPNDRGVLRRRAPRREDHGEQGDDRHAGSGAHQRSREPRNDRGR